MTKKAIAHSTNYNNYYNSCINYDNTNKFTFVLLISTGTTTVYE